MNELDKHYKALKTALLGSNSEQYEKLRKDLSEGFGYDYFRELQRQVFKEIGARN